MTNDQLSVVNNIDQFIVFGCDEHMHITSPVDYADHVAVICSVIGDIDLYQQYERTWEALFGLVDFEGMHAHQFLAQTKQVITELDQSTLASAPATSKWLHELYMAADYELTKYEFIASTRIAKDFPNGVELIRHPEVTLL